MPSIAPSTRCFLMYVMPRLASWKTRPWPTSSVRGRASRARNRNKRASRSCPWLYMAIQTGEKMNNKVLGTLLFVVLFAVLGFSQNTVRVGAFPNITHPQAMVGKANGFFDKAMGPNVKVEWKSFNAGPSAIEALFAGAIDMTYVGPNPTISGYVRSQGEALRVVAGAASGGASLIVRNDSGINNPEDFHGKRVASPQLGNTQDVALRAWLSAHGMKPKDKGGDVQV